LLVKHRGPLRIAAELHQTEYGIGAIEATTVRQDKPYGPAELLSRDLRESRSGFL